MTSQADATYDWQRFPETERFVAEMTQAACDTIPFLAELDSRLKGETGSCLVHWIDHFGLPRSHRFTGMLADAGFNPCDSRDQRVWVHEGGLFPPVRVSTSELLRLAIKVDSVADFLFAHRIDAEIAGDPFAPLRMSLIASAPGAELLVIERHGSLAFEPSDVPEEKISAALAWREAFLLRERDFATDAEGFDHVMHLVRHACDQLGVDWACDLFFEAERRYWQSRNHAARVQFRRQDRLGLGWANHDHHTYRSSRENFTRLIAVLEQLGCQCRERFYGGADAGWGAQVLEQPCAGIVIFADVDLSATEVTGDFAHEGLEVRDQLGTVGLWCKLHGEAMLQAGMHHLECQFDFEAERDQLSACGIDSMDPFTDFDHLKQSFTKGEIWPVSEQRIDAALQRGWITDEQAAQFRLCGSLGSHLEVLQRHEGYKGFNQAGISEIIRQTDPRHAGQA